MAPYPDINEIALITKIAQQDQTALAELYDRYARVIYAVAFKILGTVEEAEEVVLDVFHQVWRTASSYNAAKARVDTWLFMQTRSRALDRLRAQKRLTRVAAALVHVVHLPERWHPNPADNAIACERRALVLAALQQLPAQQKLVLELAYFQGLTHIEIANQLGEPLGTIKTRIRLGIIKLRNVLSSLE